MLRKLLDTVVILLEDPMFMMLASLSAFAVTLIVTAIIQFS
jgi:hypothetical protein